MFFFFWSESVLLHDCLKNVFVCCSRCGLFGVTAFSLCVVTGLVIVTLRSVLRDSLFVVSWKVCLSWQCALFLLSGDFFQLLFACCQENVFSIERFRRSSEQTTSNAAFNSSRRGSRGKTTTPDFMWNITWLDFFKVNWFQSGLMGFSFVWLAMELGFCTLVSHLVNTVKSDLQLVVESNTKLLYSLCFVALCDWFTN